MNDPLEILARIRQQVAAELLRVTQHAQSEMVEEDLTLEEAKQALSAAQVLENYPKHQRGACCLVYGQTAAGRDVHIVCTTTLPLLVIITVYLPKPPKWRTPWERSQP